MMPLATLLLLAATFQAAEASPPPAAEAPEAVAPQAPQAPEAPNAPDAPAAAEGKRLATPGAMGRLLGKWPGGEKRVTFDLENVRTREALGRIAAEAGWTLKFKDRVHGRVDVTFTDTPADEALAAILEDEDLIAVRDGKVITIAEPVESPSGKAGDRERVTIGGSAKVEENETVRSAVAVGGSMEVLGTVEQDAVAVGGTLKLGPKAVVKGDAVSVLGHLEVAPGAVIHGNRVNVGFTGVNVGPAQPSGAAEEDGEPEAAAAPEPEKTWVDRYVFGPARTALFWAVFFVLGLLSLSFAPVRMRSMARELERAPGLCFAVGMVGAVAVVPLVILLIVTGVGILLLPFFGLALAIAILAGFVAVALQLGKVLPHTRIRRSTIAMLAVGTAMLFVLDLVPYLGFFGLWLLSVVGFGAVLRSRFGSGPEHDANFVVGG